MAVMEQAGALFAEPLQLVTHVGRDVLANAAHFATVPKAVYEYVSNSIDATPPGRPCTVRVTIATVGPRRRIEIADDAAGMSRDQLRAFFTMHGENALRRAGRKVRGRFGTGKIAAFGRADRLRVDTVQQGMRNVAELRRVDLEAAQAGQPIAVRDVVVEEATPERDGTVVTIEDLHRGTRADRAEIVRYLQRQLGRHLVRHSVLVEGGRVEYAEPPALEEHRFAAPASVATLAGPLELVVKVAARPLAEEENGVAVLCDGYLNAMTLAGVEGKQEAQYLFGEVFPQARNQDLPQHDDNGGVDAIARHMAKA
ncbi:MAG: ATP-binding protein, partial [Chloroflexota bacterium]|nr:ATP-binding protein [Chloroflexota bacterium]